MKNKIKIINVVGARPNFMKIAPIQKEMEKSNLILPILVHTGQHYDERMSKVFFDDLGLPKPDYYLGVGSGSHASQTGKIMIKFEKILLKEKPDLVLVVGDVNSTVACAIDAVKLGIKVAHVESGLRSFDRSMPEEINRILTDSISDFLFASEPSGVINLKAEGVQDTKVFEVGNVMIDSLVNNLDKANELNIINSFGIDSQNYGLVTLHRPSNVDDLQIISKIIDSLSFIQKKIPLIFPIHPRTLKNIQNMGLLSDLELIPNLHITGSLSYLEFIKLMKDSRIVITDSGGIQEETTYFKVPCLTLRENTERPITITEGSNQLVPINKESITSAFEQVFTTKLNDYKIPNLWDGKAKELLKCEDILCNE